MAIIIPINYNEELSIKRAERDKAYFENAGFKLIRTTQTGLNSFNLEYDNLK